MAVLGHQFAPPDNDRVPAEEAELDAFFYVALFVAFYLLLPELAIALGQYKISAVFVSVPKQPLINIAVLYLRRTMSGVPGSLRTLTL